MHQNEGKRKKVGALIMQKSDGQFIVINSPTTTTTTEIKNRIHLQASKLCVLMKQKMIAVVLYNQVSVSSKITMQRILLLVN